MGKVESGEIEPSFKAFARIAVALEMTSMEVMLLITTEANELLSHPERMVET